MRFLVLEFAVYAQALPAAFMASSIVEPSCAGDLVTYTPARPPDRTSASPTGTAAAESVQTEAKSVNRDAQEDEDNGAHRNALRGKHERGGRPTCVLEGLDLVLRRALAPRDDRTRVPHAAALPPPPRLRPRHRILAPAHMLRRTGGAVIPAMNATACRSPQAQRQDQASGTQRTAREENRYRLLRLAGLDQGRGLLLRGSADLPCAHLPVTSLALCLRTPCPCRVPCPCPCLVFLLERLLAPSSLPHPSSI
eukprot:3933827-Rhodomonas_salina.3